MRNTKEFYIYRFMNLVDIEMSLYFLKILLVGDIESNNYFPAT